MFKKNKIVLKLDPHLKKEIDEYLSAVNIIFRSTRWLGIPVYGGKRFLCLTLFILSILVSIEVTAIWKLFRVFTGHQRNPGGHSGVVAKVSGAIFYANTLISLLLFWKLLRAWKSLSKYWSKIETNGFYVKPDRSIKKRVYFVTCFVSICACVEHGFSIVSEMGIDCAPSECFSRYILSSHKFILHPDDYNFWMAILIFLMSLIATIQWNFQDLVIILISMGLVSRYQRLNIYVKRIVELENNYPCTKSYSTPLKRVNTWRKVREAYVQQAELVRRVDKELGPLTILCNLNNFYFICLQLFFILRNNNGLIFNSTYYVVSFVWLVFRATGVVLAAADVNLYSKKALNSVYKCSSSGYNIELKRLIYHLTNSTVCLTGLGMFFMNRRKLFEVAAAIVKYEVILMDYDT